MELSAQCIAHSAELWSMSVRFRCPQRCTTRPRVGKHIAYSASHRVRMWPMLTCAPQEILVDPFCGSGTIAIEAAFIAHGFEPGRIRFGAAAPQTHPGGCCVCVCLLVCVCVCVYVCVWACVCRLFFAVPCYCCVCVCFACVGCFAVPCCVVTATWPVGCCVWLLVCRHCAVLRRVVSRWDMTAF
jgi:hypothetical protein